MRSAIALALYLLLVLVPCLAHRTMDVLARLVFGKKHDAYGRDLST